MRRYAIAERAADTGACTCSLAEIAYRACDDGISNGKPDPKCSDGKVWIEVVPNTAPVTASSTASTAEDTPVALALEGPPDPERFPIHRARRGTWLIDRAAASKLKEGTHG